MVNKKETVEEAVEEIEEEEIEEEEEAQVDGDASGPITVEKEEDIEVDTNPDPRKWVLKIWNRQEPHAKDTHAATWVYSELEDSITVEILDPRFNGSIEDMRRNVLLIENDEGQYGFVQNDDPEGWIRNAHLADTILGTLYAFEAEASYETYET